MFWFWFFEAFLKRLESVKPTPGLKRAEQLADYQRQVGYQGAPSYPVCVSSTKKGRSVSKTHSGNVHVLYHLYPLDSVIAEAYRRSSTKHFRKILK